MVRPFLKHFQVVGRETPTPKNPCPTVYKYEVFAPNFVVAQSRFWKLMRERNKVKQVNGDILSCTTVKDKKIKARTYNVDMVYYSQRCGYTHMSKEYRDVSKAGAVSQAYNDLASRHRARYHNIDIAAVKSIAAKDVKRVAIRQYLNKNLSFPLMRKGAAAGKTVRKNRAIFVKKNTKRAVVA